MVNNPIIIIGMHRSGTTLVTRLLRKIGLYIGSRTDHNEESIFFQELNEWLFGLFGATWSYPEPWENESVSALLADQIETILRERVTSYCATRYLGYIRYLRYRSLVNFPSPWGWKDPRTTYTLNLWLRVFPNAKVLHVHRHGVDVAASLVNRSTRALELYVARGSRKRNPLCLERELPHVIDSARCLFLKGAFTLWEQYVLAARRQLSTLPDQRRMSIRYEDLLTEFSECIEKVADYCQLATNDSLIREMAGTIRPDRSLAYRNDPLLLKFSQDVGYSKALACLGYAPEKPIGA
jgi:hypothetical protein